MAKVAEDPPLHEGHALHLFLPLPEPVGVPDGYTIQAYRTSGLYADVDWHTFECLDGLTYDLLAEGSIVRFWQQSSRLDPSFFTHITAARKVVPRQWVQTFSPRKLLRQLKKNPRSTVTIAEVVAPVGCKDPAICNKNIGDAFLESALDKGLEAIQRWQRALYARKRTPLTLITRERLPAFVPVAIGDLKDGKYYAPRYRELRVIHKNFQLVVPPTPLTNDDLDFIDYILPHVDSRVFLNYLEFLRESSFALVRDGDRRRSVLFSAMACETLLDDLLGHLLWEECKTPEYALDYFTGADHTLAKRVKSYYHERLRGSWNLDGAGTIGDWKESVANLRNRVIHGGYEPQAHVAQQALDVTMKIVSFVSDLLVNDSVLRKYPFTAIALMGEPGLRKRQKWTARMEKAGKEYHQSKLWEAAARWRRALGRVRSEVDGLGEVPDGRNAYVYSSSGATRTSIGANMTEEPARLA